MVILGFLGLYIRGVQAAPPDIRYVVSSREPSVFSSGRLMFFIWVWGPRVTIWLESFTSHSRFNEAKLFELYTIG